MSEAAHRLAQSRRAIIDHIQRREPRNEASRRADGSRPASEEPRGRGGAHDGRWFGSAWRAVNAWWRRHPAHVALELATPALSVYAERKPLRFLGMALGAGALLMIVRPWRLISVTSLLVAVVKSSQLSDLLMSALSAAHDGSEQARHE